MEQYYKKILTVIDDAMFFLF